jgi:hypothetical protein
MLPPSSTSSKKEYSMDEQFDKVLGEKRYEKAKRLMAKMHNATADEKDMFLVAIAAAMWAGHIVNLCAPDNKKEADAKELIDLLHYFATNTYVKTALAERLSTVGSA